MPPMCPPAKLKQKKHPLGTWLVITPQRKLRKCLLATTEKMREMRWTHGKLVWSVMKNDQSMIENDHVNDQIWKHRLSIFEDPLRDSWAFNWCTQWPLVKADGSATDRTTWKWTFRNFHLEPTFNALAMERMTATQDAELIRVLEVQDANYTCVTLEAGFVTLAIPAPRLRCTDCTMSRRRSQVVLKGIYGVTLKLLSQPWLQKTHPRRHCQPEDQHVHHTLDWNTRNINASRLREPA